jgi:hypothetical protein
MKKPRRGNPDGVFFELNGLKLAGSGHFLHSIGSGTFPCPVFRASCHFDGAAPWRASSRVPRLLPQMAPNTMAAINTNAAQTTVMFNALLLLMDVFSPVVDDTLV